MAENRHRNENRPDPDALLALARDGRRGRLKVFLGAAPGVGKTYAILQGARRLRDDGTDVVLGLIETHGRKETKDLIEGLEVLPRQRVAQGGRMVEEFDIDAALARRPGLLIVDELAHSNAPDSRHPKRWQDVEELLEAGIDVWTALNIQHLESLADIVSRITGVVVRETVPDRILQEADDVVVVDITPDELIERLKAGKVYVPETARRATANFFVASNLTALRELALRRTADRVDDEIADYRRQKAIEGPWGTGERLLVCIGPEAGPLVRKASRLATALNATWIAVHLERSGGDQTDPERERHAGEVLQLAEMLGAETTRLHSRDFPADILRLARRENVTQIIVGKSRAPRLTQLFRGALADQLIRQASDIGVLVLVNPAVSEWRLRPAWLQSDRPLWRDALVAAVSVTLALGAGQLLSMLMPLPNLSMIFLAAVLLSAIARGTRAAIVAAILSFLAYNFFFIDPRFTLTIARPHELFALLIFLVVAVLTGSLAGQARKEAASALKSSGNAQALSDFARRLSGAASIEAVLQVSVSQMHKVLRVDAVILLPEENGLVLRAAWPPVELADPAELSAAQWAFDKREASGWRTGTLPNIRFRFYPLATPERVIAVLGIAPPEGTLALTADQERNLLAIADQTAIALDRVLLVAVAVKAAALEENEKIREALLASLSHDLRTPLASITGAVTTLREMGAQLTEDQSAGLLAAIEQETGRLTRFVANLLDMSRIEAGALKVRRDWLDVADLIRSAADRARKTFDSLDIRLSIARDLPWIRGDAHLLGQVLFNLLDNAQKYGGDSPVSIHARREADEILISVTDEGPGIRPTDLDRVFEKFYRAGGNDGRKPGTGLGLSICRGLIEAMGGRISAESPAVRRRGTRIVLKLPVPDKTPEKDSS